MCLRLRSSVYFNVESFLHKSLVSMGETNANAWCKRTLKYESYTDIIPQSRHGSEDYKIHEGLPSFHHAFLVNS